MPTNTETYTPFSYTWRTDATNSLAHATDPLARTETTTVYTTNATEPVLNQTTNWMSYNELAHPWLTPDYFNIASTSNDAAKYTGTFSTSFTSAEMQELRNEVESLKEQVKKLMTVFDRLTAKEMKELLEQE